MNECMHDGVRLKIKEAEKIFRVEEGVRCGWNLGTKVQLGQMASCVSRIF